MGVVLLALVGSDLLIKWQGLGKEGEHPHLNGWLERLDLSVYVWDSSQDSWLCFEYIKVKWALHLFQSNFPSQVFRRSVLTLVLSPY